MRGVAREFVGGHLDGEIIVIHETSFGVTKPVEIRGETMNPPRWALYRIDKDERMHWKGDFPDITAAMQHSMDIDRERDRQALATRRKAPNHGGEAK